MLPNTYARNPITDMVPAFPGMLADNGFTDKVGLPARVTIAFGIAVAKLADGGAGLPTALIAPFGISIADHTMVGIYRPAAPSVVGYAQYDAVSILRRGRIWMLANGACTADAPLTVNTSGVASNAGTITMKNARFVTSDFTWNSNVPAIGTQRMVMVELHDPGIDAVT